MVAIGPYTLRNAVLLAPMAGVTDAPFRSVAWQLGAGYVVSEMTSGRDDLWDTAKSRERRVRPPDIDPFAVQIAGADPDVVAESAIKIAQAGAQIIDINFGCPMKKVCRKAAGSALLKDPDLVSAIVRSVVAAVDVPVTVKMRTGWSPERKDGVAIAERMCAAGAAAITVHGRTRACRFEGPVEHATAAAIKSAVDIPVFVNGDITDSRSAAEVLEKTGADGVMIGRAALGAPWLPGMIARGEHIPPAPRQRLDIAMDHVARIHQFYGADRGLRIARKHAGWYLTGLGQPVTAFNQLTVAADQLDYLANLDLGAPGTLAA